MGNSKSKKGQKEPDKFFEREKWREQKRKEKREYLVSNAVKRVAAKESPAPSMLSVPVPPSPAQGPPPPAPAHHRSYDDEALDRMRYQLHNDSDAFLLNNILLSVQFFENYER